MAAPGDKPPLCRLLVSVRHGEEARAALAGGADIIDVKDPARGPLGRPAAAAVEQVLLAVAGRRPVSVALGELVDLTAVPRLPAGVTFAKVGLHRAGPDWGARLDACFAAIAPVQPIAVAYAAFDDAEAAALPGGRHHLDRVIAWAVERRAAGVLLDTIRKDGRGVFEAVDEADLARRVRQVRAAGLTFALAGSLRLEQVGRAAALGVDIVAVRGAACVGHDRAAAVDARRVAALKSALTAPVVAEARSAG